MGRLEGLAIQIIKKNFTNTFAYEFPGEGGMKCGSILLTLEDLNAISLFAVLLET